MQRAEVTDNFMTEVTWCVQPGVEETEGRSCCTYSFLVRGRRGADAGLCFMVTGPKGMD